MKPKNKFQQQVVEASKSLPKLTKQQAQWGYDNAIEHIGRRTNKGKITCTKCGHLWQAFRFLYYPLDNNGLPFQRLHYQQIRLYRFSE